MTTRAAALALLLLGAPLASLGREVAGVPFPEAVEVGGKELKLQGAGIRKKLFIKVYAGGLYLAAPSKDPDAIVAADAPKRVRMVFLRDVDKKTILQTYREGFERDSAGPGLPALLQQLDKVGPALSDMKEGGEMTVTYVPGQGTTIACAGGGSVTVEGKEFGDAMFRNWLGTKPADGSLKDAFLGR